MPTFGGFYSWNPVRGRRRAEWRRHYEAKGCSAFKASKLAWRKVP